LAGLAQHAIGAEMSLLVAAAVVLIATAVVVRLPSIRDLYSAEPPRSAAIEAPTLEPKVLA
jgi:hypothetical protein